MSSIYFITILILFDANLPTGWVQYTKPFTSSTACREYVTENHPVIIEKLYKNIKKDNIKIFNMKCMTHSEAVELNTKLGH